MNNKSVSVRILILYLEVSSLLKSTGSNESDYDRTPPPLWMGLTQQRITMDAFKTKCQQ